MKEIYLFHNIQLNLTSNSSMAGAKNVSIILDYELIVTVFFLIGGKILIQYFPFHLTSKMSCEGFISNYYKYPI